jgi:hypothetical protein
VKRRLLLLLLLVATLSPSAPALATSHASGEALNQALGGSSAAPQASPAASPITIPAQPDQDAPILVNFDEPPFYVNIDPNNWGLGPSVRLAPTGRNDAWRPAPGVIEETHGVIEISLAPLAGIGPDTELTASLKLNVWSINPLTPPGLRVFVEGYDGDGTITAADYGPTLGGPPGTPIGSVGMAAPGSLTLVVSDYISTLLARGVPYAGFRLRVDYATLPPRAGLPDDTTLGANVYSANTADGPVLSVMRLGPDAIRDLEVRPSDAKGQTKLLWDAPSSGEPGTGRVDRYDVRYSHNPIDAGNWSSANQLDGEPAPADPGSPQEMIVSGPTAGATHYFALKSADAAGHWSGLSNVVSLLDMGFRAKPDGYRFSNFGQIGHYVDELPTDFTEEDLRHMLGPEVCLSPGPGCVLKARGRVTAAWQLVKMRNGHCAGMDVSALRFFKGIESPATYQPGALVTYDLQQDNARRLISYYQARQYFEPIFSLENKIPWRRSHSQVLADVRLALLWPTNDPLVLGMCKDTTYLTCHNLLPFAVSHDEASTEWRVWVYDSGWPRTWKWLVIDTEHDSWLYWVGGPENGEFWSDIGTHPTLQTVLLSYYTEVVPAAALLGQAAAGQAPDTTIWLDGPGHLLISDAQGRRLGFDGDDLVQEIPDGYAVPVFAGLRPVEPSYGVPSGASYQVLLDGQTITRTETLSVTQLGPDYAAWVDGATLTPGASSTMTVTPDGKRINYRSTIAQHPALGLAFDTIRPATAVNASGTLTDSYTMIVAGADLDAGQQVVLAAESEQGRLVFSNRDAGGGSYDLRIEHYDPVGSDVFAHATIPIGAADTHYLLYGTRGAGPLTLQVDHDSDGTVDETILLDNQASVLYLPLVLRF